MKIYLLILFCIHSLNNYAQQVSNIHSIQEGKQVIITYDITGGSNGDKFDVKLYYSQNNNDWKEATLGLTGDIGKDITHGINKTISWSPLKETNKLTGTGYSFKVNAIVKNNTNNVERILTSNVEFYMPNSFSPNGDNVDDELLPITSDVKTIEWKIFNTKGGIIFSTANGKIGWNGNDRFNEKALPGVYMYSAEVTFSNDITKKYGGPVTLVR